MGQVFRVAANDGTAIDAHYEVDGDTIIFHSRGGTKGKSAINTEYAQGLEALLLRLSAASIPLLRVWVDSSRVQGLTVEQRTIFDEADRAASPNAALRLISSRMKSVGRAEKSQEGGGNSTRRICLQVFSGTAKSTLVDTLGGAPVVKDLRSLDRIPAEELRTVTAEYVWQAVQELLSGKQVPGFGPSTDYDLITDEQIRLPPKAVYGLAASKTFGFAVQPRHFTAGVNSPCFNVLEAAGFRIVRKGEADEQPGIPLPAEDRQWAEGQPRLIFHLRRERAPGLSRAKKAEFLRVHRRLFCERCRMDPVETYGGDHGEACIEVHHHDVQIAEMALGHQTRLEDLQCLCASCHRVVHRLLKESAALSK
ncbi:HNH endonuclease [Pseudomonas monachiensis]|uniref:HNH endonuclease n=1 Tax=Pseudomonas monachiensis TaxID=3060212 RepID=A0ABW9H978_9PSED